MSVEKILSLCERRGVDLELVHDADSASRDQDAFEEFGGWKIRAIGDPTSVASVRAVVAARRGEVIAWLRGMRPGEKDSKNKSNRENPKSQKISETDRANVRWLCNYFSELSFLFGENFDWAGVVAGQGHVDQRKRWLIGKTVRLLMDRIGAPKTRLGRRTALDDLAEFRTACADWAAWWPWPGPRSAREEPALTRPAVGQVLSNPSRRKVRE